MKDIKFIKFVTENFFVKPIDSLLSFKSSLEFGLSSLSEDNVCLAARLFR